MISPINIRINISLISPLIKLLNGFLLILSLVSINFLQVAQLKTLSTNFLHSSFFIFKG